MTDSGEVVPENESIGHAREAMRIMLTNSNSLEAGYLAGRYAGWIGHLYSPRGFRGPYPFMPYGLDNGRFSLEWSEAEFAILLGKAAKSGQAPLWLAVPDVVGDGAATLAEWHNWAPRLRSYGWPLAFVVQDGLAPADVPVDADVIFVGGTTEWKRATLQTWCAAFERVHIGRINTEKWLWECFHAGAESCDGTGWFRGDPVQLAGLRSFLERASSGKRPVQRLLDG